MLTSRWRPIRLLGVVSLVLTCGCNDAVEGLGDAWPDGRTLQDSVLDSSHDLRQLDSAAPDASGDGKISEAGGPETGVDAPRDSSGETSLTDLAVADSDVWAGDLATGDSGCAPTAEICNGLDDDCDGNPDNGFACVKGSSSS